MGRLWSITFCLISTFGFSQTREDQFQSVLDSVYRAHPESVGILIHVEAPDYSLSWTGVAGYSDKTSKTKLEAEQPALIASNTKTYVAVAIVKLVEKGQFQLDDPIQNLITKKSKALLEKGGYDLKQITVRHLLSHTSGIADYVDDEYFEFVNDNSKKRWSREEQIALAAQVASLITEAGEKFNYGDINYLLLTEIIEKKTGKPFEKAIAGLLDYKGNQLEATWFESLEEPAKNVKPLAHQYWAKYQWDSYELDPSWDLYGGGGLASTAKDLALFFQLTFNGAIVKDKSLIEELHTTVIPIERSNYCLGLRKINFHGFTAFYHGGFWGTDAMYVPEFNASFSAITLQKDQRDINAVIHQRILQILKQ